MAQVLLLKIGSTGLPTEHSATADDVTFQTITATNGPVLSSTGIDMNNDDISDLGDVTFTDALSSVTFQVATDTANELDQLILPRISGTPTATPTNGEASTVWDQTNNRLYIWDGSAWTNSFASSSATINQSTFTAGVSILVTDCVYISAANAVNRADCNSESTARAIGFATANAPGGSLVSVQMDGVLTGFSGLTAGARYYLSEVAGGVTSGIVTTSAAEVLQVGYAASASGLLISFQHLGVRA